MLSDRLLHCLFLLALVEGVLVAQARPQAANLESASSAERRAVAYLAEEVERWPRENGCFSCHNNGDGARALYVAVQRSYPVSETALAGSTGWLRLPPLWKSAAAKYPFGKDTLALIQFTAALVEAYGAGTVRDRNALLAAGELLAASQEEDGSWRVDAEAILGAPATYGTALATYLARRSLGRAQDSRFEEAIAKADAWFDAARPDNTVDTAALLQALPTASPRKREYAAIILRSQNGDGGWGPYANRPSEPFDTALVLLALRDIGDSEEMKGSIARGREFLLAEQLPSGGWPETTRPAGNQSYAEHVSTSAWATLALLLTDPER